MPEFKRLRGFGPAGNLLANLLSLLTVNLGVAVSAALAVAAALIGALRSVALNPITYVGVGTFLAVLWTIVGVTILIDRRRPCAIIAHPDYRYALTFEGMQPRYRGVNEQTPVAGSLDFSFLVRNFSQSPIRYEIENIDIRLGSRAVPRILPGTIYGFMARGGGRTSTIRGFSKDELSEFYRNNTPENHVKGTVEITFIYGPPDGPPERRAKISLEMYVVMLNNGESLGWQDAIISEKDEPYVVTSLA